MLKCALDLACGKVTSSAIVTKTLNMCAMDQYKNVILESHVEETMAAARKFDQLYIEGKAQTILGGIPISIKDNINVAHSKTTAGSKMLESYISPYDATAVERLRLNGSVICAKANMDEFGMGSSMLNSAYGPCHNPWTQLNSAKLTAGGSSGASAAAVASGIVLAAIASDTGGSVRQPAAFCGVVGFKPTYGSISRHGLISYASSMDTVGILARSVADVAVLFDAISGPDSRDSTALRTHQAKISPILLNGPEWDYSQPTVMPTVTPDQIARMLESAAIPVSLKGYVVGVPREFNLLDLDPSLRAGWQLTLAALQDAGADIRDVSLPSLRLALPCYYMLACAEAASNLSRYDGIRYGHSSAQSASQLRGADLLSSLARTRGEAFGVEVIKRVLAGTFLLSKGAYDEHYGRAAAARRWIRREMQEVFGGGVHLLLGPTTPQLPFLLSEPPDAQTMLLQDLLTVPANLCGLPAISLPMGRARLSDDQEVPLGMQLLGPPLAEARLLAASLAVEQRVGFRGLLPPEI